MAPADERLNSCMHTFPEKNVYTARVLFGVNVVIQVLCYRLSFPIGQIIRKDSN